MRKVLSKGNYDFFIRTLDPRIPGTEGLSLLELTLDVDNLVVKTKNVWTLVYNYDHNEKNNYYVVSVKNEVCGISVDPKNVRPSGSTVVSRGFRCT
jgi:hypothetical protein